VAIAIIYLVDKNNLSGLNARLIQTFSIYNFQNTEGRVQLAKDFILNMNPYSFFGTLQSASEVTFEELSSFHNVLMDSFWYAGYFGLISSIILIIQSIYNALNSRFRIAWLFILLAMIIATPPFSDYIILSILIPFLI
jgi:hypothetical protein